MYGTDRTSGVAARMLFRPLVIQRLVKRIGLGIGAMLLSLSTAHAGVVDYLATSLGGSLWRYDYTINNTTPSIGFDELTVYFDVATFRLLSNAIAPIDWDPLVVQPDAGLPTNGFFDALNLDGLLGDGASVSGFSVSFEYLGAGRPGAQAFDLLDSSNFIVVNSGTTERRDGSPAIPEPDRKSVV